jgi:hypothetical protein
MATRTRRGSTTARGTTATRTKSDIIEVDFDDYEGDGNAYMGDDPRAGVYGFKLVNVERHIAKSSGNKGIRWTFECTDPAYSGWRGFMYSDTDPDGSKWKTQQILKAVQNGQEKKVSLDLAKPDKFLANVSDVVGRVVASSYEDEESGEVRSNSKLIRVVAESAAPKRAKGKADDEDDFEGDDGFDDADGDDEGFDEDEERAELEAMKLPELRALAKKEYGLTAADIRGLNQEDLIDLMLEDEDGDDGDDADDDADSEDGAEDGDDADENDDDNEPEAEPEPPARRRRAASTAA